MDSEEFNPIDFEDRPGYRAFIIGDLKLVFKEEGDDPLGPKEIHLLVCDEPVASAIFRPTDTASEITFDISDGAAEHERAMQLFTELVNSFQDKEVVAAGFRVELDTWEHADPRMPFGPTTYSQDAPEDPFEAGMKEDPERVEDLINRMICNIKDDAEPMDIFDEHRWSTNWLDRPMTEEDYWEGE
jgi:hypothetical protein